MVLKGRKASLELSVRAIVIVVLAMTLLGLGLGFVRNMFSQVGGIAGDVTEQVKQQILDDLITGDKKLAFPKTEIIIDRGASEVLTLGVRNKGNEVLNYRMEFNEEGIPDGASTDGWFQYKKTDYILSPANSDVRNIRLSVPSSAESGSYFLTLDIKDTKGTVAIDDDASYATKDIFIVVRG